jgi:arylsulfatase A-like enzyme
MKAFRFHIIQLLLGFSLLMHAQTGDRPNILFIAVDDLKPLLGCYGDTLARTPHIDALASRGMTFTRSYCQQAVCAPSRVSLMTSRYPDQTRVWDLQTLMRDMDPGIVTLPQYLIQKGYRTSGTGKILDYRSTDGGQDSPSWSIAFRGAWDPKYYSPETGKPMYYYYASQHARDTFAILEAEASALGVNKTDYVKARYFPAFEKADVPLDAYADGAIANVGMELLEESAASGKPFFVAVGFQRPHLPFNAPSQFWDLYKREDFSLAPFREKATGSPSLAYHNSEELRGGYTGIPENGELPEALQLELIHAYYASTSYIDHLVGMLLSKLEELDLEDNTMIVLWGDHGWHLGDHQLWCKHSNFEQATRTPLIIHYPGQPNAGEHCPSPVEFTDIAPTLCDLAGVSIPGYFEGQSLSGLIRDPSGAVREASLSQYPRNGKMGYSLRSERFRYTRWVSGDGSTYARELYDYELDPLETRNAVFDPEHEEIVHRLDSLMSERIKIPSTQCRISFEIEGPDLSGGYGPLPDIGLLLAGELKLSSGDGKLMFTHHEGQVIYRAEHLEYKTVSDTLEVKGDTVIHLHMELKEPVYQVSLTASDYYTGKKLISARVFLDEEEKQSDLDGAVEFYVEEGWYILSLEKTYYPLLADTFFVDRDTSIIYQLKATHSTVKIKLSEGSTPVNKALVTLNEEEGTTNALGIAMFETRPTDSSYTYRVNKETYKTLNGTFVLLADTTLRIQMERLTDLAHVDQPVDLKVWPNPARNFFHWTYSGNTGTGKVRVLNANGLVVCEQKASSGQDRIYIAHLRPGIYLVQLIGTQKLQQVKLLKI